MFEHGCGTGRLAGHLLARHLPADAHYLGADISDTMVALARARLRAFGDRAHVLQVDGTMPPPAAGGAFDRFVAVYLLDLLSPGDAAAAVAEAGRLLAAGGLPCAASLAPGQTPAARLVSRTWTRLWSRAPALVGGCRPISLRPLLDGWHIEHGHCASATSRADIRDIRRADPQTSVTFTRSWLDRWSSGPALYAGNRGLVAWPEGDQRPGRIAGLLPTVKV